MLKVNGKVVTNLATKVSTKDEVHIGKKSTVGMELIQPFISRINK